MVKIKNQWVTSKSVINRQDNAISMQASILPGNKNVTSHRLSHVVQATGHWIWHVMKRLHQLAWSNEATNALYRFFTIAPVPICRRGQQQFMTRHGYRSPPWYIMLCFDYLTVVNHCSSLLTERWVFSTDRGKRTPSSDVTTIARRFTGNTRRHLWNTLPIWGLWLNGVISESYWRCWCGSSNIALARVWPGRANWIMWSQSSAFSTYLIRSVSWIIKLLPWHFTLLAE